MRRATQETQWLLTNSGELLGIALGFDFCSEHEWGVRPLQEAFGLPRGVAEGVNARKITALPAVLEYLAFTRPARDKHRAGQSAACIVGHAQPWGTPAETLAAAREELRFYSEPGDRWHRPESDLVGAWDEKSFGVLVRGEENIRKLGELHEAFTRKDIVLTLGKSCGFLRSFGLTFLIDSRIDEGTRVAVLEKDRDYKRLLAAAKATGIEKRLRQAGMRWFALSPAWVDQEKRQVHFWLNPMEQSRFESGWFSVADLDAWAKGEGPVVRARA